VGVDAVVIRIGRRHLTLVPCLATLQDWEWEFGAGVPQGGLGWEVDY
jgi:hypothetical protein